MAIKIIEGKVYINGDTKEVGARLKLNDEEEKRLVNLGFAEFIDEEAEKVEVVKGVK